MPKFNLNNTLIDLTSSPEVSEASDQENLSQGKKEIAKTTLHLDMELSYAGSARPLMRTLRSKTKELRSIENQQQGPSTSRQAFYNDKAPPIRMSLRPSLDEPGPSHRFLPRTRPSLNEPCYKKLQEMMEKPLIENYEDFNCVLCDKLVKKGQGVLLKECLHSFCRNCLINVIDRVPPGKIRVDCPNVPEICESFISMDEIRALLGDESFEQFALKMSDENSTESLLPILLHMDDLAVIPNIKAFTCQVCYSDIEAGEGIILKNCLHNGCKDCLGQLISHAEQFEVQCPYVENNNPCKELIQEQEMRYLTSEEVFDKHLKKSLKIAEHSNELNFHCRGINCDYFVELTEGISSFQCKVCLAINCVPCKAVHPGKTCQDYQEEINPGLKDSRLQSENNKSEEAIAAEIAAGTAMRCPRCQIPVVKISGCDAIACMMCKLNICWVTQKPRIPFTRANGEVVDGCHCREPPTMKRCHPKCQNCH